jgi:beta-glucosidase
LRVRFGSRVEVIYTEGCPLFGSGEVLRGRFSHGTEDGKSAPGLRAEYFSGLTLADAPKQTQSIDAIDFSWAWSAPAPGIARRAYSVRFAGELLPDRDGPAELRLVCQGGGARWWINNRLVHDRWEPEAKGNFEARYSASIATVQMTLKRGQAVPLKIEYRRLSNSAALRLEWVVPGAPSALDAAVKAARAADVAIVCAGLSNLLEGGGLDRTTLALPAGQDELIAAVAAANPRTIVVLNGATAMAMPWLPQVSAVLHAFYPGEEGGTALARILCGDVAPSGRLPDTLPLRLEDVPGMAYYPGTQERAVFGEGLSVGYRHFVTHRVKPLFPFGYGLTYTTFRYTNLRLSAPVLTRGSGLEASVEVTNTGRRFGAEVVQLYVGAVALSVPRPACELRAFRKITLAPGESRRVSFTLSEADLTLYSCEDGNWASEAGEYTLQVGPNCAEGLKQRFQFESGAIR